MGYKTYLVEIVVLTFEFVYLIQTPFRRKMLDRLQNTKIKNNVFNLKKSTYSHNTSLDTNKSGVINPYV